MEKVIEMGMKDFNRGIRINACPFPSGEKAKAWVRGWLRAKAQSNS
ncbi:hypothetical protein NIAMH_43 [Serratia phage vB_SmaS_Niamh]|uniref:Uncharacterized protein n=1 Tax=Serratia phage vB_SmaS_Ulliraptor TaxID=2902694 RepID=A0AC61TP13_9CAUD|nr:hypothetical protein QJS27_gp41 [Serratia phage vB_SmaS_Ulliraptor]QPX74383.1 hypothetical protein SERRATIANATOR_27 [Serratia phage vB_SmaS_Serratianator]UGO52033.1 hypothetical protein ULLIRAPTOR_41 [Serratia phage vB_SmaS_Ulliraptor]UGO52997.1 hypothetical protein NIAMH_43 [Serratia phage vB_SmaS_Niamh]